MFAWTEVESPTEPAARRAARTRGLFMVEFERGAGLASLEILVKFSANVKKLALLALFDQIFLTKA